MRATDARTQRSLFGTGGVLAPGSPLRLGATFLAVYAALDLMLIWLGLAGLLQPFAQITADITYRLAEYTGVSATLSGCDLYLRYHVLIVGMDCTALNVIAVLGALIIAYPASLKQRLMGIVGGAAVLLVVNMVRLVGIVHVAEAWPTAFEMLHDYLFQVGMVLVALGVWVVWLKVVVARGRP